MTKLKSAAKKNQSKIRDEEQIPENDFSIAKVATGVAILVVVFVSLFIIIRTIGIDRLREEVDSFGPLGLVVYIALIIASFVFAPLSGHAINTAGGASFGKELGFVYSLIGALIGVCINYYISKRFGRQVVGYFIGKRAIYELDQLIGKLGNKSFWGIGVMSIFGGDFVAYAVGLTRIKFAPFFAVQLIAQPIYLLGINYIVVGLLEYLVR